MYPYRALHFPLLQFTSQYSAIQQNVPLSSLDWRDRIHTSKCSSLTGHALCLSPRFIKYSMKTSASFKENTHFQRSHDSSDVKIQRSRVDYGFKFQILKGGKYVLNSWVGLKKCLKQNHSRTSLLTLNNENSIHVFFRYEFYSHFASYAKQSLSNTHNKTHLHSCKSPSSSSVELCYHEGSPRAFAFESQFAQNNDPIGKKTGKTRSSANDFAFAHEKARENVFTVY